jgi:membrane protein YdbS with pleckstrin-like domain
MGQDYDDRAAEETRPADKLRGGARAAADQPDDAERELWQGGFSPRAMIGTWIGTALLTIAALAVAAVFLRDGTWWLVLLGAIVLIWAVPIGRLVYRRLNIHYRLTNQRFFHEHGILRRVTDRIEVIDMDDITFEQGVIERMAGVGNIRIASSDATDPEIWLRGIDDVRRVAGLIDDARRKERMRRGLHIEAI